MSYSATITDNLTGRLQSALDSAVGPGLIEVLAVKAELIFQRHFRALDQTHRNKLGGQPTHFWAQAANSTHAEPETDGVRVSVNQVGVRQRLQGGTIPGAGGFHGDSKWLTIPARSEAYGVRAREFSNLRFAILGQGGPALVIGPGAVTGFGDSGPTYDHAGTRIRGKKRDVKGAKESMVMYWLKKSVDQEGDPTVIPDEDTIREGLNSTARSYFRRMSKGGSEP